MRIKRSPAKIKSNDAIESLVTQVENRAQLATRKIIGNQDKSGQEVDNAPSDVDHPAFARGGLKRTKLMKAGEEVISPNKLISSNNDSTHRRTRLRNIIGIGIGESVSNVEAEIDDGNDFDNGSEEQAVTADVTPATDDPSHHDEDESAEAWLIDNNVVEAESVEGVEEDDNAEVIISDLQKVLIQTRKANASVEVHDADDTAHGNVDLAGDQQNEIDLAFDFTTPPPTVSGPEDVDELREYLETHLGMKPLMCILHAYLIYTYTYTYYIYIGMKPLMTFYRFSRRDTLEGAVDRAMGVFQGEPSRCNFFRKLLHKLARAEMT